MYTPADKWETPKLHKGVAYFPSYESARTVLKKRLSGNGRLVAYDRGWAIQYWISGPYYPEHEFANHNRY